MKQSLRKFISSALAFSTALSLAGIGGIQGVSAADNRLKDARVELSNPIATVQNHHKFAFKVASGTAIKSINFVYSKSPSGSAVTPPSLTTVGLGANPVVSVAGVDDSANWVGGAISNSVNEFTATATAAVAVTSGNEIILDVADVTNSDVDTFGHAVAGACDTILDSDTCYVRITTKDATSTILDVTTISYTVTTPITVTATVDPILSFTVSGVKPVADTNAALIWTNDAGAAGGGACPGITCGAGVDSTPTTIAFGNLTIGNAKLAQQKLNVLTNAYNGYTVNHKFIDSTGTVAAMRGIYASNKIDPFTGVAHNGTFIAPKIWVAPNGTSITTDWNGWIGIRTTDGRDMNGTAHGASSPNTVFSSNSNYWAPPTVTGTANAAIGSAVMNTNYPDNGTSYPVYVSFKIEANAYQASDTYTGTMVYNVVAHY